MSERNSKMLRRLALKAGKPKRSFAAIWARTTQAGKAKVRRRWKRENPRPEQERGKRGKGVRGG